MQPAADGSVMLVGDPWKPHEGMRLGLGLLVALAVGFMGGAHAAMIPVLAFGVDSWGDDPAGCPAPRLDQAVAYA